MMRMKLSILKNISRHIMGLFENKSIAEQGIADCIDKAKEEKNRYLWLQALCIVNESSP